MDSPPEATAAEALEVSSTALGRRPLLEKSATLAQQALRFAVGRIRARLFVEVSLPHSRVNDKTGQGFANLFTQPITCQSSHEVSQIARLTSKILQSRQHLHVAIFVDLALGDYQRPNRYMIEAKPRRSVLM